MRRARIRLTTAEHANAVRVARGKACALAQELRAMDTPALTPRENARAIRANVRSYLGTALHFELVRILELKKEINS